MNAKTLSISTASNDSIDNSDNWQQLTKAQMTPTLRQMWNTIPDIQCTIA